MTGLHERLDAAVRARLDPRVLDVLERAAPTDGHLLWPEVNHAGYAKRTINGKTVALHRWMYEMCRGVIPDGMEIDHICRVRNCVNPDHLEPVTSSENKRRAHSARGVYDACPAGHPRTAPPPGVLATCKECRLAERRRKVERGVRPESAHGKASTYNLGCRCDDCREARRAYDRGRRRDLAETYGVDIEEAE